MADTVYANATTQTRLQSETADNIAWQTYATPQNDSSPNQSPEVRNALTRVHFTELESHTPLHDLLRLSENEISNAAEASNARSFIIVGRGRKLVAGLHSKELNKILEGKGVLGNEVKKTMGDVATAVIVSGIPAGLLVVQSATGNGDA